ncbi:unnamed protein product [Paramecium sonneborni]|uniref:Protein kinase domain-containing protein n=1 Tax=Paramecium sonneborni TaxID=65129 RepID=A0A8S1RCI2_9CILI|nr:unnamed protein product [Paramecium sonneborni]
MNQSNSVNYYPDETKLKSTAHPLIFYDEQDKLVKKIECGSLSQFQLRVKQIKHQEQLEISLKQFQKYYPCLLEIIKYTTQQQSSGSSPLYVQYKCNSKSNSLLNILKQKLSKEDKRNFFFQLLELAQIHKNLTIVHKNMKPSNIIWDDNKFYLIDFGYMKDSKEDIQLTLRKNYIDPINQDQMRNLYPYLSNSFIAQLHNAKGDKIKIEKIVKLRILEDIQKEDRYALGIMMLELFGNFEKFYQKCDLNSCYQQSFKREEQIKVILHDQNNIQDFGTQIIDKISEIIKNIIFNDEIPEKFQQLKIDVEEQFKKTKISEESKRKIESAEESMRNNQNIQESIRNNQNIQESAKNAEESMKNNQNSKYQNTEESFRANLSFADDQLINLIEKEQKTILNHKMNQEENQYIKNLIENECYEFDENLLYYLDKEELINYLSKIGDSYPKLKQKAKHVQALYRRYDKKEIISELCIEDKYYILQLYTHDDNTQVLQEYEKEIQEMNKKHQKDFKFNQIEKSLTKKRIQQVSQLNLENQEDHYDRPNTQTTVQSNNRFKEIDHFSNPNQESDSLKQFIQPSSKIQFIEVLQKQIPEIKIFIDYYKIMNLKKENMNNQINNWDFDENQEKPINLNDMIMALEKNSQQWWGIYINQLLIGQFSQNNYEDFQFKGKIIQQNQNGDIILYFNVTIVNLRQDLKMEGNNVIKYIYQRNTFKLLEIYSGELRNNKKNGEGINLEITKNEIIKYKGCWKDDKKNGNCASFERIQQDCSFQKDNQNASFDYDWSNFTGNFVNDQIKYGQVQDLKVQVQGYFFCNSTLRLLNKSGQYIFQINFLKCLKEISSKMRSFCCCKHD